LKRILVVETNNDLRRIFSDGIGSDTIYYLVPTMKPNIKPWMYARLDEQNVHVGVRPDGAVILSSNKGLLPVLAFFISISKDMSSGREET
jgi:hypothetical protein